MRQENGRSMETSDCCAALHRMYGTVLAGRSAACAYSIGSLWPCMPLVGMVSMDHGCGGLDPCPCELYVCVVPASCVPYVYATALCPRLFWLSRLRIGAFASCPSKFVDFCCECGVRAPWTDLASAHRGDATPAHTLASRQRCLHSAFHPEEISTEMTRVPLPGLR